MYYRVPLISIVLFVVGGAFLGFVAGYSIAFFQQLRDLRTSKIVRVRLPNSTALNVYLCDELAKVGDLVEVEVIDPRGEWDELWARCRVEKLGDGGYKGPLDEAKLVRF